MPRTHECYNTGGAAQREVSETVDGRGGGEVLQNFAGTFPAPLLLLVILGAYLILHKAKLGVHCILLLFFIPLGALSMGAPIGFCYDRAGGRGPSRLAWDTGPKESKRGTHQIVFSFACSSCAPFYPSEIGRQSHLSKSCTTFLAAAGGKLLYLGKNDEMDNSYTSAREPILSNHLCHLSAS